MRKRRNTVLTQKELRKLIHYDAKRGTWKWLEKRRGVSINATVGAIDSKGYRLIHVKGVLYRSSRLAWFYIRGYFPANFVDHMNRNRADDRWKNLREVSVACNTRNCKNLSTNKSGVKGVCYAHKKWMVYIYINRKPKYLGYFDNFIEAVAHRLAVEQCLDTIDCDTTSPALHRIRRYIESRKKCN